MKLTSFAIFCFLHTLYVNGKKSEDDSIFSAHASYLLPIEHSFGIGDAFTLRGNIQVKTSKTTTAMFTSEVELSDEEITKLQELVDKNGLYMIRAPIKVGGSVQDTGDGGHTNYVSTFVRACYLYGSGLAETIQVAVDNSGNVIGLSIVAPPHTCALAKLKQIKHNQFNSTVLIHQQVPGAVPDTQTYVKKITQEKADQASGKGKDNRSFFAKYWMYILPVFLILMLSAQAEPEQGGEEGSGS